MAYENSRANYKLGAPMKQKVSEKIKALQTVFGDDSNGERRQEYIQLQQSTPWIRMQSGVSLSESKAKEYGLSAKETGTALAKQNILFGLNRRVEATDDKGKLFLQSYEPNNGDLPGYEQTNDFGIRPKPGITGMNIHSHNRFGSLRTAVVNFQCWSKEQIDALEILYMRPGYTVLLEWGHSKNLKVKPGGIPDGVADMDLGVDLYTHGTGKALRHAILEKRKDNHFGYDAIVGTIKNFSWKLRKDGGYDCSTTLVTAGDLIESYKANFFLTQAQILDDFILELEELDEQLQYELLTGFKFPLLHTDATYSRGSNDIPDLGENLENLITSWYQQANKSLDELAAYLDGNFKEAFKEEGTNILDYDEIAFAVREMLKGPGGYGLGPGDDFRGKITASNIETFLEALVNLIAALEVVRPTDASPSGHAYQGHGYEIHTYKTASGTDIEIGGVVVAQTPRERVINADHKSDGDVSNFYRFHKVMIESEWPALVDFYFNDPDPLNPDAPYNGFGEDNFAPNLNLPEGGRAGFQIKFSEREELINALMDSVGAKFTDRNAGYAVGPYGEYNWPLMFIYRILGNVIPVLSKIKETDVNTGGSGAQTWFCDITNVGDPKATGLALDPNDIPATQGTSDYIWNDAFVKMSQQWGRRSKALTARQNAGNYFQPPLAHYSLQHRWYSAVGWTSNPTLYRFIMPESIDPIDSPARDLDIFRVHTDMPLSVAQTYAKNGMFEYDLRKDRYQAGIAAAIERPGNSNIIIDDGTSGGTNLYSATRFLVMKWTGYDSQESLDAEDVTAIDQESGATYTYHDPNDDYVSKLHYYLRSKIENPYNRQHLRRSFSGRNFKSVFIYRKLPAYDVVVNELLSDTGNILSGKNTSVKSQLEKLLGGRFISETNLELRNYVYIRLGVLLGMLNKHILRTDSEYFFEFQTEYDTGRAPEYLTFDDHISTDPRKCILPHTLSDVLDDGLIPSEKRVTAPRILDIELSINYILDTLNRYLENDARAPMLGFLQSLLDGVSRVCGGQNDFQLQYMEDDSVFHIVDRRQLDTETKPTVLEKNALINIYGLDTIVKDINLVSKITPKMSSMIAISAQDNPYTSQDEATGFNGINRGITDLIYSERYDIEKALAETSRADTYEKLREELQSRIAGVITHLGMYYEKRIVPRHSTDTQAGMYENYCKFLFGAKTKYDYGGRNSYSFIIPFELHLTTYGISGLRVMDSFAINKEILPQTYGGSPDQRIGFLITGIEHQLDRGGWSTNIKSQIFNIDDVSPNKDHLNLDESISNSVSHLGTGGTQGYAPPGPVATQGTGVDRLKFLIGSRESQNKYEIANTSDGTVVRSFYSQTTIMDKTIGDLLDNYATQDESNQDGTVNKNRVFAMGRMQIIPSVLTSALTKSRIINAGITRDSLFNETTQEVLFDYLIFDKRPALGNYVLGNNNGEKSKLEAAINALGYEWAAYPVLKHVGRNGTSLFDEDLGASPSWRKTNYGGVGANKAESQYTVSQIADILYTIRTEITGNVPPYQPPSPS